MPFTEIIGAKYNNHPTKDVFKLFIVERDHIDFSEDGKLQRAKIARDNGFMVDPISGKGFWPLGADIASTKRD